MEFRAFAGGTWSCALPTRATVKGTLRADVGSMTPVTTSSSRARAVIPREKSTWTVPPSGTETFSRFPSAYPIRRAPTVYRPGGTSWITYRPLSSVRGAQARARDEHLDQWERRSVGPVYHLPLNPARGGLFCLNPGCVWPKVLIGSHWLRGISRHQAGQGTGQSQDQRHHQRYLAHPSPRRNRMISSASTRTSRPWPMPVGCGRSVEEPVNHRFPAGTGSFRNPARVNSTDRGYACRLPTQKAGGFPQISFLINAGGSYSREGSSKQVPDPSEVNSAPHTPTAEGQENSGQNRTQYKELRIGQTKKNNENRIVE